MTSKNLTKISFVAVPSSEECARICKELNALSEALHVGRRSKLVRHLPSISYCLGQRFSYQRTCDFLLKAHGISSHKSTLSRYVKKHPLLRKNSAKTA